MRAHEHDQARIAQAQYEELVRLRAQVEESREAGRPDRGAEGGSVPRRQGSPIRCADGYAALDPADPRQEDPAASGRPKNAAPAQEKTRNLAPAS